MPNYEIVEWVYGKLKNDNNAWKNEANLKKKAKALDTKDVMDNWLASDWANSKKGNNASLRDYIDDVNDNYSKSIKADIKQANSESDLNKIDIDSEYEVADELEKEFNKKKKELAQPIIVNIEGEDIEIPTSFSRGRPSEDVRSITQALAGEYINEIQSASTRAEVMDIPLPSNVPNTILTTLRGIRDDVLDSLPEEE